MMENGAQRERKCNFVEGEIIKLIELCFEYKDVLTENQATQTPTEQNSLYGAINIGSDEG